MKIQLWVNNQKREVECSPARRLLDLLRDDLGLTGAKEGCGEGECGACTVLLDGQPVNACLIAAGQAHERRVVTIEGLAGEQTLHLVQEELLAHGGAQCGICTPGVALSAAATLQQEPDADRPRLRERLAGNLCRCTGYQAIIDAMICAAERAKQEGAS